MTLTSTGILHGIKALARPLIGTVTHVATSRRAIALTFDDGPDPKHTPALLEILGRYDAKATFFMVGASARKYPHLVRQTAEAGHAVANHSWNHPSFPSISSRERRRQLRACRDALAPYEVPYFRAPGGHLTPRSALDVRTMGYMVIGWDLNPKDYLARSAEEISGQILKELRPGNIVLLHDSNFHYPDTDRHATVRAVDMVLESTHEQFDFVTVPQLMAMGRPQRINAFWRPEAVEW